MPAEGPAWQPRPALLSHEEIERVVRLLARMGVRSVRLTGGEPLVRRDLAELVRRLSAIDDLEDLSLTTNGYLLERDVEGLVAAGLRRLNVSLDSLVADRFFELTRRDALAQVLAGLEAAQRHPSLRPIKVNVVALRDFTEQEVVRFAEFARERPFEVRFIEFMPLDADQSWDLGQVLPNEEIRADPRGLPARAERSARRARRRGPGGSPTVVAGSGSSHRSASRSAATATASGSPRRGCRGPACSR